MIKDAMSRGRGIGQVMMRQRLILEYLNKHRPNGGAVQRSLVAAVVNSGKDSIWPSELMNGSENRAPRRRHDAPAIGTQGPVVAG
jgi:hypothetical protein